MKRAAVTRMSFNPHVERYLKMVENGEIEACKDQHLLVAYVRKCFETEDIYTDEEQLNKYLGLSKYFPFDKVFEWEEFCIALHLCTYWRETGRPRWPDLFLLIGRGAGKDGFIALESISLVSPYNPIREYDVDICANAEEQAMRPVNDILNVLEDTRYRPKMKKFFYWTKEKIVGLKYRGTIKGRTNNPKSKDGMRSGIVIFNEIHQYPNYDNIKVFITGLGKKKHPRRLYATTNGDVRDGPLDELLARSEQILKGDIGDNGLLPFICRLDDEKEADDKTKWVKANPSLPYLPHLMTEIEKEYIDWKENPIANADFMTKRMNLPQSAADVVVTDWENIAATNKSLPDLVGWPCTCGIDYASVGDFASVNLHFKDGDIRYDINHSWLCLQSKDLHRLAVPWREWAEFGYITLVDDVEIHPDLIAGWILEQGQRYQIKKLALDNFRYALISNSLNNIGFDAHGRKNIKLIRPSDIMKVQPVIDSAFNNQSFVWGDNPPLRWATNNTKLMRTNTGNYYYAKIEPKSRKTDPFQALVHSMVIENELDAATSTFDDIPVIVC
jgi:phage terminase large subunit-like protein